MALRSRPRTTSATSGPGRAPASDGRLARRRAPGSRAHARPRSHPRHGRRHAPPEDLRRRAEALFGERVGQRGHEEARGEPGKGPPLPGPETPGDADIGVADIGDSGRAAPTWRERTGQALRERMPLWLQTRCGLERRSVAALAVLLVVAAVFAVQHFWSGRTQSVAAPEVVREAAAYGAVTPGPTATAGPEIVVDVGGKVRKPGIHSLPAGSRVADALRAAGGVRPGTKTDGLNRARFLVDGEQVIVGAPAPAPATRPGEGAAPSGPTGAAGPAAPVSLNT
ncbi:SLBB domain-containing protein, partial [Streptomyces tendae]|uniref:SLBB domain-containing protein n=1 Tax=Streptomyces tendae TaxID=1932 RepID=UPI003662E9A9